MRRILVAIIIVVFVLSMASCSNLDTWQGQYNLGTRYLSKGNYKEAIIAFTAAIEIDPANASAYIGRADAYQLSEETEDSLRAALKDYLKAIELAPENADVYMKAAEAYISLGLPDAAKDLLEQGFAATNNEDLRAMIDDLFVNEYGSTVFSMRQGYRDFEKLTEEEQNLVVTVLNALKAPNKDLLVQNVGKTDGGFYTIYNDCKIELHNHEGQLWVEMRPESGVGYFCQIDINSDMNYYDYGYCPCVNWQWNGVVHETDQRHYNNSTGQAVYYEATYTAELSSSLKIGEGQQIETLADGSKVETKYTYESGRVIRMISRDNFTRGAIGEWTEWKEIKNNENPRDLVGTIQNGHFASVDSPWGMDALWW